MARAISKNQVSNPGPSWPSCSVWISLKFVIWERVISKLIKPFRYRDKAVDVLEDLLIDNPFDMTAIRFACGMYVENGYYPRLRDCCGRVLPYWTEATPFYG